jgi:MFS family permease
MATTTRHASQAFLLLLTACSHHLHAVNALETASETVTSIFDSTDGLSFSSVVMAVAALLVGLLFAVAGYRLFHTTAYALGFIGGGTIVALIIEKVFSDKSWVLNASWIAFCVGGVLCGYLVSYIYWLGVFVAGAVAGAMLAILVNTTFGYLISPAHPGTVLIVLAAVFALVCGALAVKLERPVLVVATSFVGAYLVVMGIGYFAGDYPSFNDLTHYRTYNSDGDAVYDMPAAWWAYLVGTLVLFALSVLLQFRKTGRGINYHLDDRRAIAQHDQQAQQIAEHQRQVRFQQQQQQQQQHYVDASTPEANYNARYSNQTVVHATV